MNTKPQIYPGLSLSRFGQNVYGENLFRIVFSDSRRFMVMGEWPDGSVKASEEKLYWQHPGVWVLEQWRPAECSLETWKYKYPSIEWPERGDYYMSYLFDQVHPENANIEFLINCIKEGCNRSEWEVYVGCRDAYDAQMKDARREQYDCIYDRLSYGLDYAMSSARVSRGTKTKELRLGVQDLHNMPQSGGKFQARPTRRKIA